MSTYENSGYARSDLSLSATPESMHALFAEIARRARRDTHGDELMRCRCGHRCRRTELSSGLCPRCLYRLGLT